MGAAFGSVVGFAILAVVVVGVAKNVLRLDTGWKQKLVGEERAASPQWWRPLALLGAVLALIVLAAVVAQA